MGFICRNYFSYGSCCWTNSSACLYTNTRRMEEMTRRYHAHGVEIYNLVLKHLPLGRLLLVVVVEERHEEEDVAVAEAVVAVAVMVDLPLIHNKLLHNSSGLVKCQDKRVVVTGNAIKSTAAKQRLITLWHVLIIM